MAAENNNSNLFDMLDSFIETQPVNNRALNSLLHAMLRRLHILEKGRRTGAAGSTEGESGETGDPAEVAMDVPMEISAMPPSDFDGQSKLRSRIQICEDGLSQVMGSIKELRLRHQALAEKVNALGKNSQRMGDMEESLNSLRATLLKYPDPEELKCCVTWDEMQAALFHTDKAQEDIESSKIIDQASGPAPFNSNLTSEGNASPSTPQPAGDTVPKAAPSSAVDSEEIPGTIPEESPGQVPREAPGQVPGKVPGEAPGEAPGQVPGKVPGQSPGKVPGEAPGQVPGEAPGQVPGEAPGQNPGQISGEISGEIPGEPPGQNPGQNPGKIAGEISEEISGQNPGEPPGQIAGQNPDTISGEIPGNTTREDAGKVPGEAPGQSPGKVPGEASGQSPGKVPGKVPGEGPGEAPGQSPGKVPGENPGKSSGEIPEKISGEISSHPAPQAETGAQPAAETSSDQSGSGQRSKKPSNIERYSEAVEALRCVGKLEEKFIPLMARMVELEEGFECVSEVIKKKESKNDDRKVSAAQERAVAAAAEQQDSHHSLSKYVEIVNDVQEKILQLQEKSENLLESTRNLQEDSRQKQSRIEELDQQVVKLVEPVEELFKGLEETKELMETKVDKDAAEIEMKSLRTAVDGRVSRLQLDSATEQLNNVFQELLIKVAEQGHDFDKVIEELTTEMDQKLDRAELDAVKVQLEMRWKNFQRKLQQTQEAADHMDAAGTKKHLVDKLNCLSCDRPLVAATPGQHFSSLPSLPAFPPNKSTRPQVRQLGRSERPPELNDCIHLAVPRSSGGSHTVTSASQRRSRLQGNKLRSQPEGEVQLEEAPTFKDAETTVSGTGRDGPVSSSSPQSSVVQVPSAAEGSAEPQL